MFVKNDCEPSFCDENEERLAEILDEYLIAVEAGKTVDIDAFIEQHREFSVPLRSYLAELDMIRELADGSRDCSHRQQLTCEATIASGTKLGPYLLGPIVGRGAMGVVYRAYDTQYDRYVALKVLAFGTKLDSNCIDRFRREAKTAALLDHPNVVPVYAVGCERGVNYYSMQLIEGASLDRRLATVREGSDLRPALNLDSLSAAWNAIRLERIPGSTIDASPLEGPDKYRRIAQLCSHAASALHAVHLAGVIHRDVKPSNLLLGNDGQLWVTDFGLARVQAENGLTRTGELVGTVRYMSPEQASGKGDMIDARTDVYGLGATLYELVTNVAAFPGEDMMDLLRQIQTCEPPSPHLLEPNIPRDLETIILRAMRPSAADRYPTAAAMAEDLNRFVSGKSIRGQPVTYFERVLAWARKHRSLAISLLTLWFCIVALSLITTVSVVVLQSHTAAALRRSDELYRQARSIVDTLGFRSAKRLARIPEADRARQEILTETIRYYQQFIDDSADDPRLRRDVATTSLEIARLVAISHDFEKADAAYRQSVEQLRDAGETLLCVRALNEWALLASEHGDHTVAVLRLDEAFRHLSDYANPSSDHLEETLTLALTHNNRGVVLLRNLMPQESAKELKQAIGLLQPIPADMLRDSEIGADLADAFSNFSVLLDEAKEYSKAVDAAERSLAIRVHSEPNDASEYQGRLAITYNNLAAFQWHAGRSRDSIVAYQRSVDLLEKTIRQSPDRTEYQNRLAVTLNNLGIALVSQGALADAELVYKRAVALAEPPVAADPADREAATRLAGILNNRAVLLRAQKHHAEADAALKQAAQLLKSACDPPADNGKRHIHDHIENNLKSRELAL